jgi:hypothetical protein
MKNLNKIKGLTLIEVMVLMSLILGFILIFLNMDMATNEKQNTRKIGTQLNMIVSAVDKRISIEGKSFGYWKNGTSWSGPQFKDFLRQELIGANNTTCGNPSKGWKPTVDMADLDIKSQEGKAVDLMHQNALKGKLIPCTLWTVYPYDIVPSAKITSDANNNLASVVLSFKFANDADWIKGFSKFNESYSFAKEEKNTTLLTTKSFYYTNASQNIIDMNQCMTLKNQCSMNLKISVGSSSTDDKKFKVDSSNSFETNLGFAKSVQANQQIECQIWTKDSSTNPPIWNTRPTACGVTGGSNGDKEVGLIGDNIDAQNIKITGRCIDYKDKFPVTGSDYNSECGMIDNGTYVQLNSSELHALKVAAESFYVNKVANINVLDVNKSSSSSTVVDTLFKSVGKSLDDIEAAKETLTDDQKKSLYNRYIFDKKYRPTPAAVSFKTQALKVKNLQAEVESIISKSYETTILDLNNKLYAGQSTAAKNLIVSNNASFVKLMPYSIAEIKGDMVVADPDNNLNTVMEPTSALLFTNDITSNGTGVILGDITAKNIKIAGVATSEQLNFRKSYTSNSLLKVSKSLNFDGLTNKYIYPKGYMSGWGAEGYSSNSGIFAKEFKLNGDINGLNGDLNIISTARDTDAYIFDNNWGFAQNYMGYRNGIELTYDKFPDTRGMFYMNDMGKVLSSGYYDTGNLSGIRIGGGFNKSGNKTGFFWGREPDMLTNEFGDRPIITNLASSIYGYNVGDDISTLNNGYKMIVNNLTVYAALQADLYSGANYHAGLPTVLSGNTITSTPVPINYVTSAVGEYWETADGIFLRNLNPSINYYLNRISYIYGQYVNLNKLGTIKGSKGDRGSRGQTGVNGLKGETGSQGIPGAVGDRLK